MTKWRCILAAWAGPRFCGDCGQYIVDMQTCIPATYNMGTRQSAKFNRPAPQHREFLLCEGCKGRHGSLCECAKCGIFIVGEGDVLCRYCMPAIDDAAIGEIALNNKEKGVIHMLSKTGRLGEFLRAVPGLRTRYAQTRTLVEVDGVKKWQVVRRRGVILHELIRVLRSGRKEDEMARRVYRQAMAEYKRK
jgi:hypothetical protein